MKYEGRYEFSGHAFPGRTRAHLRYSGLNQKPVLTEQALRRGAEIINRVMIFELLKDKGDGVIGALGISTREDRLIEFEAKAVILGTGRCTTLYPSPTPALNNNRQVPPTITGDGRAMAYRAGAELFNLELCRRHAGPKYFLRGGQGSWIGVARDRYGKAVGPFITKPEKECGDITLEVRKLIFEDYNKSGRGPVYMDCRGISDDDLEYMFHWLRNEGYLGFIDHLAEEGIDLRKNPIEFQTTEMEVISGIRFNQDGETAVKGLWAAGDEFGNGISFAGVFGWSAGGSAATYAKGKKAPDMEKVGTEVGKRKAFLEEIRTRENGPKSREAHIALQQIMNDYAGVVRSESLLEAGLDVLRRLKAKAHTSLMAENPHELMHCLEVLNLIDIGELVFIAANDRKETRDMHVRPDYPLTNPLLSGKVHIVKNVDNQPVTEWKEAG